MMRENETLKVKQKDSHPLIKCPDLFERYSMLGLSFNYELSQKFKHYFEENVFLLVKKNKKNIG